MMAAKLQQESPVLTILLFVAVFLLFLITVDSTNPKGNQDNTSVNRTFRDHPRIMGINGQLQQEYDNEGSVASTGENAVHLITVSVTRSDFPGAEIIAWAQEGPPDYFHGDLRRQLRNKRKAEVSGTDKQDATNATRRTGTPPRGKRTAMSEFTSRDSNRPSPLTSTSPQTKLSNRRQMFLCDHPPKQFSSRFLGYSYKVCEQHGKKWDFIFTNTMELCLSFHRIINPDVESLTFGSYTSTVGKLKIVTHKSFVRTCLPLFRRFNNCEEREFLTVCWEDRIVFFHSSNCSESSNYVFLAAFLLQNDTECFQEFCDGRQNVVDSEVGGVVYRLMNTNYNLVSSCGYMTSSLKHIYRKYSGTLYLISNNHWPCCYSLYVVLWAGLPEDHGLNGAWSYLPASCQAGEVLLIVLVACVAVSALVGNLLVVVVMMSGGHRGQESSLLRTSLAFSDLLTAIFVVVPSFFSHLSPFFSPPQYTALMPNRTGAIPITNAMVRTSGFRVFQSILFNTTSTVSLLTLLVLSLERFVIAGRFLRYKYYFNFRRTVAAITLSWTMSFANALWFAAHRDGSLDVQWLTFEKLPTGASGAGPGGLRNVLYHGQFVLYLAAGVSMATFSVLAIKSFVEERINVAEGWRRLQMKASSHFRKDNRHVLVTMTLMIVLFLVSTIPLALCIIFNSLHITFHHVRLFSYLAWWLFVAAAAWNPWVYNLRSRQFHEEASRLLQRVGGRAAALAALLHLQASSHPKPGPKSD